METDKQPEQKVPSWRRAASILIKVAGIVMAVVLVYRLISESEGNLAAALGNCSWRLVSAAVLCYGIVNLIAAWRWKMLLDVQGIHVPFFPVFRLTMIGVFFSQVIPGSVSGDVMKLAYVMKYGRGTESFLTIAVDRYVGLFGLFAVAALSCLVCLFKCPDIVFGNKVVLLGFAFVWGAFASMPLLWFAVLYRRRLPGFAIADRILNSLPAGMRGMLERLFAAVDLYRNAMGTVLAVFGMSCLIHSLLAVQIFLLGRSLNECAMSFIEYVVTAQLGNATGIIPLTPGGMGVRDTVSSALLDVFGASPMEALSLIPVMNTLVLVLWSLTGLFFLVMWRRRD